MVKAGGKSTTFGPGGAAYTVREAKLGNMTPLADYLRVYRTLTVKQREFLVQLLERSQGKRGKNDIRQIEKLMIAFEVNALIKEGLPTEAAVAQVVQLHGVSRSTVFTALRESKKPK